MGRKHLEGVLLSAILSLPLWELHAQSVLPALGWDPSQPGEGTLRGPWGDSGQSGTLGSGQWLRGMRALCPPCPWPGLSPHRPELPAEGNSPMCQKINGLLVIVEKCLVLQPRKGTAQLWPCPPHVSLLLWDPTASALPRPQHCFWAPHSSFLKMSSLQLLSCFLKNC